MDSVEISEEALTKLYEDRFDRLAAFLDTLDDREFDFRKIVTSFRGDLWDKSLCGTTCCALGWLPKAFPKEFEWCGPRITPGLPTIRRKDEKSFHVGLHACLSFFNITIEEAVRLFVPWEEARDDVDEWADLPRTPEPAAADAMRRRHGYLLASASAREVATHIRKFTSERQYGR